MTRYFIICSSFFCLLFILSIMNQIHIINFFGVRVYFDSLSVLLEIFIKILFDAENEIHFKKLIKKGSLKAFIMICIKL